MGEFILTLVGWTVGTIAAFFLIRIGLILGRRLDLCFRKILQSRFRGFTGYFRLPFRIGLILEFSFYLILGRKNYWQSNWWSLKCTAYIMLLFFPVLLLSCQHTLSLISLILLPDGLLTLFETNTFLSWVLVVLMSAETLVIILLVVESILMHYFLAPVRIVLYSILLSLFGAFSLISLFALLLYPVIWIITRFGGTNPFHLLRRKYDPFIESLEAWREKKRFLLENKPHKKIRQSSRQEGV